MTTHGFPPGYFIIKSVACDRVLDINGDEIEDGTEVILWVETEKSLVESKDCFLWVKLSGLAQLPQPYAAPILIIRCAY